MGLSQTVLPRSAGFLQLIPFTENHSLRYIIQGSSKGKLNRALQKPQAVPLSQADQVPQIFCTMFSLLHLQTQQHILQMWSIVFITQFRHTNIESMKIESISYLHIIGSIRIDHNDQTDKNPESLV